MRGSVDRNRVRFIGPILTGLILLCVVIGVGVFFNWALAGAVALAGLGWGAAGVFHARAGAAERRLSASDRLRAETEDLREAAERRGFESDRLRYASDRLRYASDRRLQTTLAINRGLAEAASGALDERGLMNHALSAITGLVGALGCSFVPVDEWQQPLPAFTFGQLPAPVLNAWSTHLATHMLRERCGRCQILESTPGACPLHPAEVGNALAVYCLPLTRPGEGRPASEALKMDVSDPSTGRTSGVLHLYLPAGLALDQETRLFLDGLLKQIAQGYEAARLRAQEQVTLRQLRMLRAPEGDFTAALGGLLDGLMQALAADFVLVRLRPSTDERLSNLNVLRGEPRGFATPVSTGAPVDTGADAFERVTAGALETALAGDESGSPASQSPVWLALPLALPGAADAAASADEVEDAGAADAGADALTLAALSAPPFMAPPLGMILVGKERPGSFHPRQRAILQTVAAQAALLVENERMIRSLEYQVVIQERVRLAREIHDGLAQTLAYLKLQAAQMQSYLAQGDTARLGQVLKDNYQVLAEAYLDTRQAIDNLRLTPQKGLEDWLERSLSEFERSTGLRVERSIQPLARPAAPEVQAQMIRIIQEALTNIRKHARAHAVRFSLREWQGQQIIEVTDDGLGFAAEDVPEISRHGLRGMRERAEWIGAEFQITSQPRQGTTVRLALPISREGELSR